MENSGVSPTNARKLNIQHFTEPNAPHTDNSRTYLSKDFIFAMMDNSTYFTQPVLRKGTKITSVPRGSTRDKEQALQDWYIEYYFTDITIGITKKRIKVRDDINTYKDPATKLQRATTLLLSLTALLEEGFNPLNPDANVKLRNETISITIEEAILLYTKDLFENGTRKKSIQTYSSKLNYFGKYYPDLKINAVTTLQIENFLKAMRKKQTWNSVTYNAARQIIYGFMEFMVKQKYISVNPVVGVDRQKKTEGSTSHKPINEADLRHIVDYLNKKDKFTALFVKAIYYTCLRPKELRGLTLGMIDLDTNRITIPGHLSKNRRTDSVVIDASFKYELQLLDIGVYISTKVTPPFRSKVAASLTAGCSKN